MARHPFIGFYLFDMSRSPLSGEVKRVGVCFGADTPSWLDTTRAIQINLPSPGCFHLVKKNLQVPGDPWLVVRE